MLALWESQTESPKSSEFFESVLIQDTSRWLLDIGELLESVGEAKSRSATTPAFVVANYEFQAD